MSEYFDNNLDNDLDNYEPLHKKIKYEEPILIQFEIEYLLEDGNIHILEKNSEKNENYNENYKPILQLQVVEGADVYIIGNMNENIIDINKGYTLDQIFNYFINNKLHIGTVAHYNGKYGKNTLNIQHINTLEHSDYSNIKLHYTASRYYDDNNAWRTIGWDLFSEYVPKN